MSCMQSGVSKVVSCLVVVLAAVFSLLAGADHATAQSCAGGGAGEPLPCLRPLQPTISCIEDNLDGTYTVDWGYVSSNLPCCPAYEIPIRTTGVGEDVRANFFTPAPIDRGQPSTFVPGTTTNAFSTTWDGTPLTWTLRFYESIPVPPFFVVTEASATADASNQALLCPNNPPICNAGGPYTVACGGTETVIQLDGSASQDPEGRPLDFLWEVTCDNGSVTLENPNSPQARLILTGPGLGVATNCTARLTVSDRRNTSTCQAAVSTSPCNLDCLGQINGPAQLDLCGVCNGTNACLDCRGVPNGTAQLDRCGVCDGDGQSCLGCESEDIFNFQVALDSNALQQRALVNRAAFRFARAKQFARSAKLYARKVNAQAEELYRASWITAWSLPRINTVCANVKFCVTANNNLVLDGYREHAQSLRDLAVRVAKRYRRAAVNSKQRRSARVITVKAQKLYQLGLQAAEQVPDTQSRCS